MPSGTNKELSSAKYGPDSVPYELIKISNTTNRNCTCVFATLLHWSQKTCFYSYMYTRKKSKQNTCSIENMKDKGTKTNNTHI